MSLREKESPNIAPTETMKVLTLKDLCHTDPKGINCYGQQGEVKVNFAVYTCDKPLESSQPGTGKWSSTLEHYCRLERPPATAADSTCLDILLEAAMSNL